MGRSNEFWTPGDQIPITGTVHLPPTREAIEHIHGMQSAQRMQDLDDELERKDQAVKTARARNSPYAMGGDREGLQRHLKSVHGAWPEDVGSSTEELARWHKSWHGDDDWGHDHT